MTWNYTTFLNIAAIAFTIALLVRFLRTGGSGMMKMRGRSRRDNQRDPRAASAVGHIRRENRPPSGGAGARRQFRELRGRGWTAKGRKGAAGRAGCPFALEPLPSPPLPPTSAGRRLHRHANDRPQRAG